MSHSQRVGDGIGTIIIIVILYVLYRVALFLGSNWIIPFILDHIVLITSLLTYCAAGLTVAYTIGWIIEKLENYE